MPANFVPGGLSLIGHVNGIDQTAAKIQENMKIALNVLNVVMLSKLRRDWMLI